MLAAYLMIASGNPKIMEHELPRIHVAKLAVNGHTIWFKSCISEPSIEEMKAWAPRCREEALKRGAI